MMPHTCGICSQPAQVTGLKLRCMPNKPSEPWLRSIRSAICKPQLAFLSLPVTEHTNALTSAHTDGVRCSLQAFCQEDLPPGQASSSLTTKSGVKLLTHADCLANLQPPTVPGRAARSTRWKDDPLSEAELKLMQTARSITVSSKALQGTMDLQQLRSSSVTHTPQLFAKVASITVADRDVLSPSEFVKKAGYANSNDANRNRKVHLPERRVSWGEACKVLVSS